jgi:hypothetical protein
MQLNAPGRAKQIRGRLSTAACMLLASGVPGMAKGADASPNSQLDVTTLLYGEAGGVRVVEPTARFTLLRADGSSFFGQLGIDAITGASPSGALPSGVTQTFTSASGHLRTSAGDEIPTVTFKDNRLALDGGWVKPFGNFTSTLEGHFSREKDYESIGVDGSLSIDFNHHLTTLSFGAGYNQDSVFPVGGVTDGLADPGLLSVTSSSPKQVMTAMVGISRVLTRRWMMSIDLSRTAEQGYLTEPYKILSIVDGTSGLPIGQLTENRPSSRTRNSILASSVFHLADDVVYGSYRYYWDDWDDRSHTIDLRYRHELGNAVFVEPHLRYYVQSAAGFFRSGLIDGAPLPDYATSDYRLGPLTSVTLGATLGFRPRGSPGEWIVRAEYIGQRGDGHPADAVGVQRGFDLYPAMSTGSLVVGYSLGF